MNHEEECFITYPNTEKRVETYETQPSFLNALRDVWICDETLLRVFHITSKDPFTRAIFVAHGLRLSG